MQGCFFMLINVHTEQYNHILREQKHLENMQKN